MPPPSTCPQALSLWGGTSIYSALSITTPIAPSHWLGMLFTYVSSLHLHTPLRGSSHSSLQIKKLGPRQHKGTARAPLV